MNWKELINAFHDGELAPPERARAKRLLKESPKARAYLRGLHGVDSALDRVPDIAPAASLADRFRLKARAELGVDLPIGKAATTARPAARPGIHRSVRPRRRTGARTAAPAHARWLRPAVAAAAALLLVLGVALLDPFGAETDPGYVHHDSSQTDRLGHLLPPPDLNGGNQHRPGAIVNARTNNADPFNNADPSQNGDPANNGRAVIDLPPDAPIDLLLSSMDYEALARMEEEDLAIVSDPAYHETLASYDGYEIDPDENR